MGSVRASPSRRNETAPAAVPSRIIGLRPNRSESRAMMGIPTTCAIAFDEARRAIMRVEAWYCFA
jgi:hypothetical protein